MVRPMATAENAPSLVTRPFLVSMKRRCSGGRYMGVSMQRNDNKVEDLDVEE